MAEWFPVRAKRSTRSLSGWTSVAVLANGQALPMSESREVPLQAGQSFEVVVGIAPELHSDASVAEPLVITGGIDRPTVQFEVAVDSDHPELRRPRKTLVVEPGGAPADARFVLRPDQAYEQPPWLWVRVSQGRRTGQSIHLTAGTASYRDHPSPGAGSAVSR